MPGWCSAVIRDLAVLPEERCGWILDDWSITLIRNASPEPKTSFLFDYRDQYKSVMKHRDQIIGMFHTHPSGIARPSPVDIENWPEVPGLRYWIGTKSRVTEWRLDGSQEALVWDSADAERELVAEIYRASRRL